MYTYFAQLDDLIDIVVDIKLQNQHLYVKLVDLLTFSITSLSSVTYINLRPSVIIWRPVAFRVSVFLFSLIPFQLAKDLPEHPILKIRLQRSVDKGFVGCNTEYCIAFKLTHWCPNNWNRVRILQVWQTNPYKAVPSRPKSPN